MVCSNQDVKAMIINTLSTPDTDVLHQAISTVIPHKLGQKRNINVMNSYLTDMQQRLEPNISEPNKFVVDLRLCIWNLHVPHSVYY